MDHCNVLGCEEDLSPDSDRLCIEHKQKADKPETPADVINAMGNAVPTGAELANFLKNRNQ